MKRVFCAMLCLGFILPAFADDRTKDIERLQGASKVLSEIMDAPDKGIPQDILGSAKCVAVVPSYLRGGFVLAGSYGKGVASCRTANGWSAPAFFKMTGGSFGFQIGGEAVDYIMLIMNNDGMEKLLQNKFKLGADASVAAGPVGRHTEGATDWKLNAQVLTYSRAKGAFAGISLSGTAVHQDQDDTRAFYGRMVPFRTLLLGNFSPTPNEAKPWIEVLTKYAPMTATQQQTAAPPAQKPAASQTPEKASPPQK